MEGGEPAALVLAASRAAGLAPYACPRRLRVSRCALLYSWALHLALGVAAFSLMMMGSGAQVNTSSSSWILWQCNTAYLEFIILVADITARRRLGDTLFIVKRLREICNTLKCNYIRVSKSRICWILILMALTVMVIMLLDSQSIILDIGRKNYKVACLTSVVVLFDLKLLFLLLLTMQFVCTAKEINSALQGINEGLERLYKELCPRDVLQNEEYDFPYPKDKPGLRFIIVNPKTVPLLNYYSAAVRLRSYANAYVSTCSLAYRLGRGAGSLLFLLVTFSLLNLLRGVYYVVLLAGSLSTESLSNIFIFAKAPINCFLHVSRIVLLVGPCHGLAEQLENTRFLVSHIYCETSSCSDVIRAELNVFFIHLNVNQPIYSALGMFPVGRPLLLTIVAFVMTYLAVLVGV